MKLLIPPKEKLEYLENKEPKRKKKKNLVENDIKTLPPNLPWNHPNLRLVTSAKKIK